VIQGGTVIAQGCATSGDAGIDSDMGIHIHGGTVIASGNMLDRISESQQNYAVFQFSQSGKGNYTLKDSQGNAVIRQEIQNSFTYLVISDPSLTPGDYTLWQDDTQLQGAAGSEMGGPGGRPGGMEPPQGEQPPEGQMPPQGQTPPQKPDGEGHRPGHGDMPGGQMPGISGELSALFHIQKGGNSFTAVQKCN
jgi:hypothetical protein